MLRLRCIAAGPCLALALLAGSAAAEDRALLIGVGRYQASRVTGVDQDLKGIDLDLGMMQDIAGLLGYRVHVLADEQATLAAVDREIQGWLIDGVAAGDRVLLYFSSHGSQIRDENGDEADGLDEVLILNDTLPASINGRDTLRNALVDDHLGELLARIPSRDVLVVIDACHSGTATRGLLPMRAFGDETPTYPKRFTYPGQPSGRNRDADTAGGVRSIKAEAEAEAEAEAGAGADALDAAAAPNYVALTAARDDQLSRATVHGSLFTLGLSAAIHQAANAATPLSPAQLHWQTEAYIRSKAAQGEVFNPVLSGSEALAARPLRLATLGSGHGPLWNQALDIVRQSGPLSIKPGKSAYVIGEALTLTVDVPRAGYLNVVSIDARDGATVLFPNRHEANNRVGAGRVVLPTPQLPFDLRASRPDGPNLLVAILTDKPVDLYRQGEVARDAKGVPTAMFGALGLWTLRGFEVVGRPGAEAAPATAPVHAGLTEVRVCNAGSAC